MNKNEQHSLKEDEALVQALSPIINKLIDKNYEDSKDKIASQMAPLMGVAIREQIKSQKDDIIDALYPVMGNMISKYISKSLEEMLNSINDQIQSGLSFETLKRKLKAKARGISEAELLLEQNSRSQIKALFLIHKESGIVLANAQDPNTPINEPEMVASMMTAIRSFVNDWILKNEEYSEIGEIDYGGSKIVIESSGHSYLAVIIDGAAYNKTYEKIRITLENIIYEYGDDIREFDGNLNNFPNVGIYKSFATLLNNKEEELQVKKKLHPLIFLLPTILLIFLGWNIYISNLNNNIAHNIKQTIYNTSLLTSYRISTTYEDGVVELTGEVPQKYYKTLANDVVQKIDGVKSINNKIIVVDIFDNPLQINSNIAYLLNGINLNDGVNITYQYSYPLLTLKGNTWDKNRKDMIMDEIKKINGIREIDNEIDIVPPNLRTIIYFTKGNYKLNNKQKNKLLKLSKSLKSLDKSIILQVKGYSDSQGTKIAQQKISKNRAKNIAYLLKNTFLVTHDINASIGKMLPQELDIKNNPDSARCCIISLKYQEE